MTDGNFRGGSDGKEFACNAGNPGLIPGSRLSTGEGNGNPLQDSCLENSMARGAWKTTVHGVAKSQIRLRNSHFHFHELMSWFSLKIPLGKILLA